MPAGDKSASRFQGQRLGMCCEGLSTQNPTSAVDFEQNLYLDVFRFKNGSVFLIIVSRKSIKRWICTAPLFSEVFRLARQENSTHYDIDKKLEAKGQSTLSASKMVYLL